MSTGSSRKNTFNALWQTLTSATARRWFHKAVVLVIFSLLVNHLADRKSFPDNESYRFPIEGFLTSIALCIFIAIIAHFNFEFYKKKYFCKKVEAASITWFMLSTMGYITLMYMAVSFILITAVGGQTEFYYLLVGLLLTLLISFVFIGLWYARDLYDLYKLSIKDAEITIESGAKTTKVTYENIACFYSENKIVYTVQNDGTVIHTDFTLNELEEKINDQLFYRANRQMIIHKDAVDQIEKIENGKLRVRLKAALKGDAMAEITISRYKRKEFMSWFQ